MNKDKNKDKNDRVVLITGASGGLGRDLAKKFFARGYRLVLASRNMDKLNELKDSLTAGKRSSEIALAADGIGSEISLAADGIGSEIALTACDVTKEEDVLAAFEAAIENFGRVDILVNNAGIGLKKPFYEIEKDEFEKLMQVNATGVFLFTKYAHEFMEKGRIITISSIAGIVGAGGYSAYCASKHAVNGFLKAARHDLKKSEKEISISWVNPYKLKTSFDSGYAHKAPDYLKLDTKHYADYVVALAEGKGFLASCIFTRNLAYRIKKMIVKK